MPERLPLNLYNNSHHPVEVDVATEAELLEFANKVREAGGANILEALLPSKKGMPSTCLIANALNFSCQVKGYHDNNRERHEDGSYLWGMFLPPNMTGAEGRKIADKLDLRYRRHKHMIELPIHIGNAAQAFDAGLRFGHLVEE